MAAIMAGVGRLAAATAPEEVHFVPYPATWLNRDGWLDEYPDRPSGPRSKVPGTVYIAPDSESDRQRRSMF